MRSHIRFARRRPWTIRVRLFDAMPDGIAAPLDSTMRSMSAANRPMELSRRRGRRTARPLHVRRRGAAPGRRPSGSSRASRASTATAETTVVPSLTNVRRFRLLAMQTSAERRRCACAEAARRRHRVRRPARLRPGRRSASGRLEGDGAALAADHARATIERSQTVIALIDCGRAMTQLAGRYSRFEHVLSAALVLSDVAATSGDRVGLHRVRRRCSRVRAAAEGTRPRCAACGRR